ncbi:MAG: hypothetical protein OES57_01810 [Acidimicrobiia bacterium]|nr:hypothetical protein [Acidimicrobiia bacterium]
MTGPWWCRAPRDVIAIGGSDASSYLQGQISQDVSALAVGQSAWSLVLAPQGKVEAFFRLHALDGDRFVADCDPGAGARLTERLERFRLRVDVTLEPLDWQYAAVRGGPEAPPPTPRGGVVAEVTWPGFEGYDVLGPAVTIPDDADERSVADLEYTRVAAGWPAMGRELTERTIPAEAGIVEFTVSFTKGCFTGQELVARIDSRGNNTPRRLVRLESDNDSVLADGATVTLDGADVGTVTSAVAASAAGPPVALAYLHRSVELPATVSVGDARVSAVDR